MPSYIISFIDICIISIILCYFNVIIIITIIFSLVSEDAKGLASNQIDVQINLCGVCNNGGTCDFTNTRSPTVANSPDTFKLAACKCTTGWGGKHFYSVSQNH